MDNKNYFLNEERASDYGRSRPSFHAEALNSFHKTPPSIVYDKALDIGCGTGQSTHALVQWANKVEAIDVSQAMLKQAPPHENIHYQVAAAEDLPFSDNEFDMIFVASSLHWFERRKFLHQVSRVLVPHGKILIYDSYILEGLQPQFHKLFADRFPRPFNDTPLATMELDFFNLVKKESYKFDFKKEFTPDQVIEYFYTLSNVEAAIARGEKGDIKTDIRKLIESQSTGTPFKFQVQLTEISKK